MFEEFTYEFGDDLVNLGLALLILAVGYVAARLLGKLVARVVRAVGDERISRAVGVPAPDPKRAPSRIAANITTAAVLLFAVVEAFDLVGFDLGVELVTRFLAFGADVLLGLAVLGLGLYVARLAGDAVGGIVGDRIPSLVPVTRVAVVVLAVFMALDQMGIAGDIVRLLFGITVGAVALAAALAFGLGCREHAGRWMDRWMERRGGAGPGPGATPDSREES